MTRKFIPIVFVLSMMLVPSISGAQSVRLNWNEVTLDTSGNPETVIGYYVSYGTTSGNYTSGFSTGDVLSTVIPNLVNGQTYYFVVRAIDAQQNNSAWSNEASWTVPFEDCNGVDDDYDGVTDEDLEGQACPLQDGVCAGAFQVCSNGGWSSCDGSAYGANYEAVESSCDGLDNDCDGATDEDLTAPSCDLQQGVCQGSHKQCGGQNGWSDCGMAEYGQNYEAEETTCDSLDNDCDGATDEGLDSCCTEGDTLDCSTDEGECTSGQQVCDAQGRWSDCDGVMPSEETCDGLDNDCDGETDEGLSGSACPLQEGVCAGSHQMCDGAGGWLECDAAAYGDDFEEQETRCDGLDNDCDGATDEDLTGAACPLQQGVCAGSTQVCGGASGWIECSASSYGSDYETEETRCDELDNDCDGETDEDGVCDKPDAGGGDGGTDGGPDVDNSKIEIVGGCGCAHSTSGGGGFAALVLLIVLGVGLRKRVGYHE